jgi:uncharacterized protein (DUF1800 family)
VINEAIDPRWAWEPFQPSDQAPWDLKKVGHLYRRASFASTWPELQAALQAGPEKTIAGLLEDRPESPDFTAITRQLAEGINRANNGNQARAWWLYRMLYTANPLREKMTLFWHNHFATSNAKVNNAGFMLGQYELMRKYALGDFRALLQEMSKDPAMMIWLDTSLSKKGMPNENYARELMELFTLGIGNYTEKDIREAARAFTGWEIKDRKATFNEAEHDPGQKTVLGQSGNWQGADIVRICLEQKACPLFIVAKLYRFLVSETIAPSPELLEPLAKQFKESNYDFGKLVVTVLRSNLFFSPMVYRTRVKSPVDFALGIVHALEGHLGTTALSQVLEELGQKVFYPPSVKGWDGGQAWLNGQTLLTRQNLALALTSTEDSRFGNKTDPAKLADKYKKQNDKDLVAFFLYLFLQGDVPTGSREKLIDYVAHAQKQTVPVFWTNKDAETHRVRALCHLVLTLPEFQLD